MNCSYDNSVCSGELKEQIGLAIIFGNAYNGFLVRVHRQAVNTNDAYPFKIAFGDGVCSLPF